MKSFSTLLKVFGLAALLATMPAFAQGSIAVKVHVPYAFQAGDVRFAAGDYILHSDMGSPLLWLQNQATNRGSLILTTTPGGAGPAKTPQVRFRLYGDKYYLASIWNPQRQTGRELSMSQAEREAFNAGVPFKIAVLKVEIH
jgi:hypothetical protein